MRRFLAVLASSIALAFVVFSSMIIVSLVQSEVLPAFSAGSFNIQTNSRILNRVWEGNQLYWLIAAHATIVLFMAVAFALSASFVLWGGRRKEAIAKPEAVVPDRQNGDLET